MKKLFLIIIFFFFIFNCTPRNQFDYKDQNKRFDFSSRDNLIDSLELYFKKFENDQALIKLNDINFSKNCGKDYYDLIINKTYENFIIKNPQEFICFIEYLNFIDQSQDLNEIYFISSQAFLRHLSPLTLN